MAILGALLAVALPQFSQLATSVRFSFERSDIEQQLLELPQVVRQSGRSGVLRDPADAAPVEHASDTTSDGASATDPRAPQTLHLDLPQGWTMRVAKPILYRFTGACSGGTVELSVASAVYRYALAAPLCRPEPVAADAR